MKKIYPYLILTVVIATVVFIGVRFLTGEEDTWLCVNGEWVKYGQPRQDKPTAVCELVNSATENSNIQDNALNANSDLIMNNNTNMAQSNKESCETKGGIWGFVGLSEKEMCNLPTTDGGRECLDGSNCETKICLAELSGDETQRQANGEVIQKSGHCPEWQLIDGCHFLIEGGVVTSSICFD